MSTLACCRLVRRVCTIVVGSCAARAEEMNSLRRVIQRQVTDAKTCTLLHRARLHSQLV